MLTFHCDDFEEVTSEEHQESKKDEGMSANIRGTASFKVRCIHDGQIYTATFFTSEMDKVSYYYTHHVFCLYIGMAY